MYARGGNATIGLVVLSIHLVGSVYLCEKDRYLKMSVTRHNVFNLRFSS